MTVKELKKVELFYCLPFVFLHAGCLGLFWVGISPFAVITAVALYFVRMFAITAFYHRYFSHRTFKTSRFMQFVFAILCNSSVQKGPLWWAAHHREHHRQSDGPDDLHSPVQRGFWWSQIGWITSSENLSTDYSKVKDWAAFPELVFLNRYDWLVPAVLFLTLLLAGNYMQVHYPMLHTSGAQLVVWGFFISTVVLFHATSSINSLSHLLGNQRYPSKDNSKNNFILALITLGEGWHNNHHHYPNSVRQGFFWWEIDVSYYLLKSLSALRLIYDLQPVPARILSKQHAFKNLTLKPGDS